MSGVFTLANIARWRGDPAALIEELLLDPETGEPFELNASQRGFLSRAFALTDDGRLAFPELVFSAPNTTSIAD